MEQLLEQIKDNSTQISTSSLMKYLDVLYWCWPCRNIHALGGKAFGPCGWGSKTLSQTGTLVSGNMDQNLRNPSCLILSHTHVERILKDTAIDGAWPNCMCAKGGCRFVASFQEEDSLSIALRIETPQNGPPHTFQNNEKGPFRGGVPTTLVACKGTCSYSRVTRVHVSHRQNDLFPQNVGNLASHGA